MRYVITFDFDAEGDPPSVEISEALGPVVAEVHEEPTCTADGWTWSPEYWVAGPLALRIVALLNGDAT